MWSVQDEASTKRAWRHKRADTRFPVGECSGMFLEEQVTRGANMEGAL
jgi:hypothetical protein